MKRIVICVSGGGTNLQTIIDACQSGMINGKIVLVLSSARKAYALERAKKAGIPSVVIHKDDYPDMSACQKARHEAIMSAKPDLVVLAGFLGILPKETIAALPFRIINTHPALIPAFCGKGMYGHFVHEAVLAYGAKVSGSTIHFVDEGTDTGAIIAQKAVPVYPNDTPDALAARVLEQEHILLPKAVMDFCNDCITVSNRTVSIRSAAGNDD
ncbi:MAG: phosphoribosylglycinamide formyltransferase [Eubacteriales bacterium]|nr:phosphoribosylglycinamide formyltransferase [Eubacteriales bacterium]MDD3880919.1 phosphoribosylglycinamide formyltransferase [Eubacteriales bacterium]MDD4511714.1 phosphoribosylglycinamide formyltransferase [Eubacteriales bacterium]